MKRIIDGKRYDTANAVKIAGWHNGAHCGDFSRCDETLYKTEAGAYFLHGAGGASSCYATSLEGGRSSGGGSALIPMSRDEAAAWAENRDATECLETHFSDTISDA